MDIKKIKTALVSVFNKENLDKIGKLLKENNIKIISTGGTAKFLEKNNIPVVEVQDLTYFPAILSGRVKTLHPKIFGGILAQRDNLEHTSTLNKYNIPLIDLVIVDLYPFEQALKTNDLNTIIENIDIGGISLIRAAAKNYKDVVVIPSKNYYDILEQILKNNAQTDITLRKKLATEAFKISSHYDTLIYHFFEQDKFNSLKISLLEGTELRYGENPHQKGKFFGNLSKIFDKLNGKEISYNNILDIDSALDLINEFEKNTVAIIKHTNPCGLATRDTIYEAWQEALSGDPKSAFGGIIIANNTIDQKTAQDINNLFYEILIAPDFEPSALKILTQKKKRIILKLKSLPIKHFSVRTAINGFLMQETDKKTETIQDLKFITNRKPTSTELEDLIFANKIVKHTKSNAIVLVKNKKLIGSGMGLTSRVDALLLAIQKAKEFNHDLKGAVLASDAFLPFDDVVRIAHQNGITAVIQPGGSIRDQDSIDFCNKNNMAMVFTGIRHFKH